MISILDYLTKKNNLMFVTKLGLFSIRIITTPTSIWSNQQVKLITSACLNLVE
jgi:hypothetical protein